MSHIRAWLRVVGFLAWSAIACLVCLLGHAIQGFAPAAHARSQAAIGRTWARGVAWIVGLHVSVHGRAPDPPFILVSNHLGYVDIITLMAHAPAIFVSRGDLADWPVLGRLARASQTIFVDRALRRDVVRVNEQISGVLEKGRGVILFPEGTSSRGEEVLPFRSSLLEPAAQIGHPVSYATLGYQTPDGWPPASLAVCWWGDMTFLDHFYGLLRLPRIDATLVFGNAFVQAEDRRELAKTLRAAVARQFTPVSEARWA